MRIGKKAAAVIIAVILLASALSACSVKNTGDTETDSMTATPQGTVLVPEYISMPADIQTPNNVFRAGDMIYFSSYGEIKSGGKQGNEDAEVDPYSGEGLDTVFGNVLYRMKTDGTELARLEEYVPVEIPEDKTGYIDITNMCVDKDGNLWVAETGSFYHFDGNDNYVNDGTVVYLRRLDTNGAELARIDISEYMSDSGYFYISSFAVDNEGLIYLPGSDQNVMVFDGEGKKLFELDTGSWIDIIISLPDGRVAALSYENGRVLKLIDSSARSWGESYPLPMNVNRLWPGGGEYDVYCDDSSYLIGIDLESGENKKILNWINCDINSDAVENVAILPDGRILCFLRNFSYYYEEGQPGFELALITEKPADQVPQKTVLTLATMYTDYDLRAAVINFNKKNDKYRIEVKDYSEYSTEGDYYAGLLKLSTDIISGNVPDILGVSSLPYKQYITKGLLEDLYPYIDADENIGGRDALMTAVLEALETNGSLYQISSSFSVSTAIGSSKVVGEEMGWTVDEFSSLMESLPEDTKTFAYMSSSNILYYVCAMDMDTFVDWSSGKCFFDSQDFIKVLEFASMFPKEIDWSSGEYISDTTLIQEGKLLLTTMNVGNFQEIQLYEAMFGGDITFKGFPCESGIGNAFIVSDGLAMTTACKDKEGAWEFMRYLLTEEYQNSQMGWRLPTNRAAFESALEKAMEKEYITDENGQQVELSKGGWGMDGLSVDLYATTQEQADQIMELIENTDKVLSFDENIMSIVSEEALIFFEGQKSAAETAAVIQSRVEIYVNEQR